MSILSIAKSLLWFIKNPKYISRIPHIIAFKFNRKENTKEEAEKWCRERAIFTGEALGQVFPGESIANFSKMFEKEIKEGEKKVETCPVQMGGAGNLELLYNIVQLKQCKKSNRDWCR